MKDYRQKERHMTANWYLTISIDKGTRCTYLSVNVFITDYKLTSDKPMLTSLDTLLSKYLSLTHLQSQIASHLPVVLS